MTSTEQMSYALMCLPAVVARIERAEDRVTELTKALEQIAAVQMSRGERGPWTRLSECTRLALDALQREDGNG
jgi:hypothetical protein